VAVTEREALYAAVCAHPDEDTPRLALADWLDEHGDKSDAPRARFIRVQIGMTQHEEQSPAWRKLYAEERKLLTTLTRAKALIGSHSDKRVVGGVWYERGFLADVRVYAKRFLAEADRFFADDPIQTVRFAKLTAKQGSVPPAVLFRTPHLAKVRKLDVSNAGLGTDGLCALADAPQAANVRELILHENPVTAEGLSRVIDAPNWVALRALDFNRLAPRGDDIATALAARPGFRKVRALDLFMARVSQDGAVALAESPHSTGLEVLRVGGPDFTFTENKLPLPDDHATAVAIAGSPHLRNLKELDLSHRRIGIAGLRALVESPHLQNLRRLRLRNCALPAGEALPLVKGAKHLRGLYVLELGVFAAGRVTIDDDLRAALPEAAIRFE
jgi:uncharacterized protein (TIGR02996 family)